MRSIQTLQCAVALHNFAVSSLDCSQSPVHSSVDWIHGWRVKLFPRSGKHKGHRSAPAATPCGKLILSVGGATRPLTVNFCTRRGHTRRTVSAWHHAKPLSVALDLQQQVCVLSHRPRPTGGEVSVTRGRAHTKKKKVPV